MPEGDLAARRGRLTDAQRALLERRLKGSTGSAAAEETEAIPRREGSGPAPLSLAQERVWWFARRHPESRVGNVYHAIGLTGPLAREALRSALAALVARHEVLRTRFPEVDGAPVAIASGPPPRLPMVDLAALPPAPRTEEGLRAIAELAAPPFDLERGPVLRTALLARGARENALALAVHHIAIDGWSLALLANEIAALYEAFVSGRPPALPEPPLQAADFASWQRRQIATGKLEDELSWWCERLSGAEIARPPLWPRRQGAAGGRVALNLDAGRAEALRAFARAERATPFQMILAAYQAVLGRRFGIDDVIVGTPFSLRGRPEVARLVGFLLNLLTLRTDLSGNPTFRQALDRTRETALGAFARREVPFELLARELAPGAGTWETPWVHAVFNMPTGGAGHAEALVAAGVAFEPVVTGEQGTEFDFTLYARELPSGLRFDFGYNPNLLTKVEAGGLLAEIGSLLAAGIASPDRRLSQLVETLKEGSAPERATNPTSAI